MIKVERIKVYNIANAIYSARNALNSWDKSDSDLEKDIIGENDLALMRRLYKASLTGNHAHRKYLRQIFVSMDITAPLYWISELDTYKVGVTRNSCSFMHKGVSKPFEITDFSIHDNRVYEVLSDYNKKTDQLIYKYNTEEYKIYTCSNGRKYKVYKNGKVVSCAFDYTDNMNRHRVFAERECKPSLRGGYYELHLGGGSGKNWMLHKLVATVWLPNNDVNNTVNHIDGNKGNNCVENLEWIPLDENIRKGFESGLFKNGKSLHAKYRKWKNGHTVVDPFIKTQIKKDRNNGFTCKQIAKKYNITVSQANHMISISPSDNNELFILCYAWETILNTLNKLREEYLDTKDNNVFQQIRCLLPSGYNQRSTITMNYENVINIILQRTGHRLTEWEDFCTTLKNLPYLDEIMKDEKKITP